MYSKFSNDNSVRAIVVAASTGGPQAIRTIFARIGKYCTDIPVFIVQHMPDGFAGIVTSQLTRVSGLPAAASRDGQTVTAGHIYVVSSGSHLQIIKSGLTTHLRHTNSAPVNYCKPSANVLFESAANAYGSGLVAIVLSGMGVDGLEGCRTISEAGGRIFTQDRESSAVWGMPGAVACSGIDCSILPPEGIANKLSRLLSKREAA